MMDDVCVLTSLSPASSGSFLVLSQTITVSGIDVEDLKDLNSELSRTELAEGIATVLGIKSGLVQSIELNSIASESSKITLSFEIYLPDDGSMTPRNLIMKMATAMSQNSVHTQLKESIASASGKDPSLLDITAMSQPSVDTRASLHDVNDSDNNIQNPDTESSSHLNAVFLALISMCVLGVVFVFFAKTQCAKKSATPTSDDETRVSTIELMDNPMRKKRDNSDHFHISSRSQGGVEHDIVKFEDAVQHYDERKESISHRHSGINSSTSVGIVVGGDEEQGSVASRATKRASILTAAVAMEL